MTTPPTVSKRIQTSETGARVDAVAEWRSPLTAVACGALLYLLVSGLVIYLTPFSVFAQFSVLIHTAIGLGSLVPIIWYLIRHWWVRRKGRLSHYQLLGYGALIALFVATVSGLVVTWQGLVGPRMSYLWDQIHLVSSVVTGILLGVHLLMLIVRKIRNPDALARLRAARRIFFVRCGGAASLLVAAGVGWGGLYADPAMDQSFPDDYNWKFGADRPFAPSLARVDHDQWKNDVQDEVLAIVGGGNREVYLAAYRAASTTSTGFFSHVRLGLDKCELDDAGRARVESVLDGAAIRLQSEGAIDSRSLAGSANCGTSGCHTEIYEEWLPGAHRYSAMDELFQRVQEMMAVETSPEHTRYCAGCHDPISLFSGAKDSTNVTLSSDGFHEGTSCLACHSIVQTDVQGNGDYTMQLQPRYAYEQHDGDAAKFLSDFLIRTYPKQHVHSYSRALYKTEEFCAACHKQYLDKEVNTDIGKVQGQNQYDSWKNSRWYHEGNPEMTVGCRECHMPLVDNSRDPGHGDPTDYNRSIDDGKHRSHRMLASNQYIPVLQNLEGAEEHIKLTEAWLRGEIEIPEIADKWTTGPVVRMRIEAPETVAQGEMVPLQVILTNNKTGHDFPTGPLDMIESWVEIQVTDTDGAMIYRTGELQPDQRINNSPILYKADDFDRRGEPVIRHNLWDLVGVSYKRSVYPGVTDSADVEFQCPSMGRGRIRTPDGRNPSGLRQEAFELEMPESTARELRVTAILWYRKANPEFMEAVFGADSGMIAPVTEINRETVVIKVVTKVVDGIARPE